MELALITAQQVAVLFLLIGTGMVAVKSWKTSRRFPICWCTSSCRPWW
jgi:hypothetical protein